MTQTIPTLAQSIEKHIAIMNGYKFSNDDSKDSIIGAKTFDSCHKHLYEFISNVPDVTIPEHKEFLMKYENVLRFIKLVNRPGVYKVTEESHAQAYKLAYDNFTNVNL